MWKGTRQRAQILHVTTALCIGYFVPWPGSTRVAGRIASGPNRPEIRSRADSASRHDVVVSLSPSASWVAAAEAGTKPLARTPTSRSRVCGLIPEAAYSAQAVA